MSVGKLDGHTIIANPPNWEQRIAISRKWESETVRSLRGQELRRGLRSSPVVRLRYTILTFTLEQREILVDRLREAVETGQACIPNWGRGEVLSQDYAPGATNIVLNTPVYWDVAYDDPVHFYNPATGLWEQPRIDDFNTGHYDFDLKTALTYNYLAGHLVHNMLFGRIWVEDPRALTDYLGEIPVVFEERAPVGELLGPTDVPSEGNPVVVGSSTLCDETEGPQLEIAVISQCSHQARLTWTAVSGATNYRLYRHTTQNFTPPGEGTQVYSGVSLTHDQDMAVNTPYYFRVIAEVGGGDSTPSNEVTCPAITFEAIMRAIQERYHEATVNDESFHGPNTYDDYITWPSVGGSGVPGNYPPDGWYSASYGVPAEETQLDQAILDAMWKI